MSAHEVIEMNEMITEANSYEVNDLLEEVFGLYKADKITDEEFDLLEKAALENVKRNPVGKLDK